MIAVSLDACQPNFFIQEIVSLLDHSGHPGVVTPEVSEHCVSRRQGKRSLDCAIEARVWAVEEPPGMSRTIRSGPNFFEQSRS